MFNRIVWIRALGSVVRVPHRAVLTTQGRVLFERAEAHDAMGSLRWEPCPCPDEYLHEAALLMGNEIPEEGILSTLPPVPEVKESPRGEWRRHKRKGGFSRVLSVLSLGLL
jgi:hypothetical protein